MGVDLQDAGPREAGYSLTNEEVIDTGTLATSMSHGSGKDICRSSRICWDGSVKFECDNILQ